MITLTLTRTEESRATKWQGQWGQRKVGGNSRASGGRDIIFFVGPFRSEGFSVSVRKGIRETRCTRDSMTKSSLFATHNVSNKALLRVRPKPRSTFMQKIRKSGRVLTPFFMRLRR
ncbi:hypothetical protein Naga_101848g1 [Nannochloropsis gaditana]|uniref:Uncharacterized protein n=1 Tax=Nannochloropsis gaditana TaxID=72520 RepID=W7TBP1_9STRA|nr:hypothetical protein Naga_101848g1 [Nannochloropsis gaditana]